MKNNVLHYAAGIMAALALSHLSNAQNTSYRLNSTPVNGTYSSAFGTGALANTTTGIANIGVGNESLYSNVSGSYSTAVGYQALYLNTADQNSAFGFRAMKNNVSGTFNTATGLNSLYTNYTGSNNTANGHQALYSNFTGGNNSATGHNALYFNTSGSDNVANGQTALYSNTTGGYSVAVGVRALYSNSTGSYNVAMGWEALNTNASNHYNTAIGYQTLYLNTADNNTGLGLRALKNNTTGTNNAGSGMHALYVNGPGSNNSAHGFNSLYSNYSGSNNTGLGYNADVATNALSNAMVLGAGAVVNLSNKVRIGNTGVTVIEGQVPYTWPSDARFKENVTEEVKGLAFIKLLRPVVYNFNTRKFEEFLTRNMPADIRKAHLEGRDFGPATAVRQSGFIAQEVEQAAKTAGYNFNGVHIPENDNDNYSLAYAEFVVPLVKGMQEQQKMIEDQQQVIEQLRQKVNELLKQQGSTSLGNMGEASGASMEQNAPNPFSRETVVKFNLPQQVKSASMVVYDLSGKQLKTFTISQRGSASITITSDNLAAGMYIYTIIADGHAIGSKRMVVADK